MGGVLGGTGPNDNNGELEARVAALEAAVAELHQRVWDLGLVDAMIAQATGRRSLRVVRS